jgi:putative restriction endonuclease
LEERLLGNDRGCFMGSGRGRTPAGDSGAARLSASAITSAKPNEFGETGENWSNEGWRLPVAFKMLETALRPKAHMDTLAALLPETHSPIRASGDGNQGVYLAAVPSAMAAELTRLLSGQVEQIEARHRPLARVDQDQDPDARSDRDVFARTDIGPTEKQTLVNARRGQGLFRERVIQYEGKCRVTGVDLVDHLRASHIKPWKASSDLEKLDGNNGLLLAPHIDHLFDQGYLSFTDFGDPIISAKCSTVLLKAWGID